MKDSLVFLGQVRPGRREAKPKTFYGDSPVGSKRTNTEQNENVPNAKIKKIHTKQNEGNKRGVGLSKESVNAHLSTPLSNFGQHVPNSLRLDEIKANGKFGKKIFNDGGSADITTVTKNSPSRAFIIASFRSNLKSEDGQQLWETMENAYQNSLYVSDDESQAESDCSNKGSVNSDLTYSTYSTDSTNSDGATDGVSTSSDEILDVYKLNKSDQKVTDAAAVLIRLANGNDPLIQGSPLSDNESPFHYLSGSIDFSLFSPQAISRNSGFAGNI